jgi:alpha-mannosidase
MISSDENTPQIKTEIVLFNSQKKIEFRFEVHKEYTTAKEAVYFAFPASVPQPHFAFASQQGWVDPAQDLLRGGSLEWFTIQQWMAVHDHDVTVAIVPLDAPLATFGDINKGKWPDQFNPPSATIFSYAMNNYWDTNYRAGQNGVFTFRFLVTSSGTFDAAALTRLGLEDMRPAEVNYVVSQDKVGDPPRPLPATGTSFLETSSQDIALVTWKQAEDGNGTILRLAEISGRASETALRFPRWNIASARRCSGVEDDSSKNLPVDDGTIHIAFRPFEVVTLRVLGRTASERRHSKDTQ